VLAIGALKAAESPAAAPLAMPTRLSISVLAFFSAIP